VTGPKLESLWKSNYSVYSRRKLWKATRRDGMDVGRDQVARLMAAQGIRGASRAKKRFTTKSDATHLRAPDLVNRNFTAPRPDGLWVADFTYCSTWSGIVYVVLPATGQMEGCSVNDHHSRPRCTQHAGLDPPAHEPRGPDLSHRRREPIDLDRLHRADRRRWRGPLDRDDRRQLRLRGSWSRDQPVSGRISTVFASGGLTLVMTDLVSLR
jgi:hypothetical protein